MFQMLARLLRRTLPAALSAALTTLLLAFTAPVAQAVEAEGFTLEDSIVEGGVKLQLNGYAVRKRGYFKTELASMYVSERATTPEDIYKGNRIVVLRRTLLRDIPMSSASRYFVSDFKTVTTDAEFKQLISEIGELGALYGSINRLSRGDVVEAIWTPGKGMTGRFNGRLLTPEPTNSRLFFEVYMRQCLGPIVSPDYRDGLLGRTGDAKTAQAAP